MTLPIVFVHGIRVSGSMWNTLRSALPADLPSVALDLPGHGTRRGERFTMEAATRAVADCIDSLGGRALVVGLSLGGYVAIATAARYRDKVAGVVAMGCTAKPGRWTSAPYRLLGFIAAKFPNWANRMSARALKRSLPEPLARAFLAGGLSCEVGLQVVRAVLREEFLSALTSYPGRVWLINGSRDIFRRDERAFLRACQYGELLILPGRGHLTTLLDAEQLATNLSRWAGQLGAAPNRAAASCRIGGSAAVA